MLLIITGVGDATADYLCERLSVARRPFFRLDTDADDISALRLDFSTADFAIRWRDTVLRPSRFANVWFRRPKPIALPTGGDAAEDRQVRLEWAEALEGFLSQIPPARWMNQPAQNVRASHKIEQLIRARRLGMFVPETIVTQDPGEAHSFWTRNGGAVVVKPLASGYVERDAPQADTVVYTNAVTDSDLGDLELLPRCPTLFQARVRKKADVRICVVDHELRAVELLRESGLGQVLDIRRDNMDGVQYREIDIPDSVEAHVRALVNSYDLRFAAIDMVVDNQNTWYFLEVNPNGQWAWIDLETDIDLAASFLRAFASQPA